MIKLYFSILFCWFFVNGFAQRNPGLTASYDKTKDVVVLRWQVTDASITSVILQKSADGQTFADIVVKPAVGTEPGSMMKFADEHPAANQNYYRLKIFRSSDMYEATLPVMLVKSNPKNSWIIYPVPAGPVLHLQYNGSGAIEGVISVQIQNVTSGQIFNRLRMASTARKIDIPIDNLGKGVYDIRVFVGNEITWNQRFVK